MVSLHEYVFKFKNIVDKLASIGELILKILHYTE